MIVEWALVNVQLSLPACTAVIEVYFGVVQDVGDRVFPDGSTLRFSEQGSILDDGIRFPGSGQPDSRMG